MRAIKLWLTVWATFAVDAFLCKLSVGLVKYKRRLLVCASCVSVDGHSCVHHIVILVLFSIEDFDGRMSCLRCSLDLINMIT